VKAILTGFLAEEQGQDLIEYALLMAFVALASAALFIGAGWNADAAWADNGDKVVVAGSQTPK
jgi:Flp pilus assembly pilin Flp